MSKLRVFGEAPGLLAVKVIVSLPVEVKMNAPVFHA